MVTARTPIVSQKGNWIYSGASRVYIVPFEIRSCDTNDTCVIPSVTTVKDVALVKKSDQTACTFTISTTTTNQITVTSTLSAVDLLGVALAI